MVSTPDLRLRSPTVVYFPTSGLIELIQARALNLDAQWAECRYRAAVLLGTDDDTVIALSRYPFGEAPPSQGYPFNVRFLPERRVAQEQERVISPARIWLGRWYVAASTDWGTVVPELATIDANDNTRLEDGSRLVDAYAIAAVWRFELKRARTHELGVTGVLSLD
jgi:hypothetical protein